MVACKKIRKFFEPYTVVLTPSFSEELVALNQGHEVHHMLADYISKQQLLALAIRFSGEGI